MAEQAKSKLGKPELRQSDLDDFELGAEVDGVWVSFARIQGEQVRSNVANHKEQESADPEAS